MRMMENSWRFSRMERRKAGDLRREAVKGRDEKWSMKLSGLRSRWMRLAVAREVRAREQSLWRGCGS